MSKASNPIELIINAKEKQKKELKSHPQKHKDSNQTHSLWEVNKTDQENVKITFWLCTGNHKISNYKN